MALSNVEELQKASKGPHLWDETFSWSGKRNCFKKVIYSKDNICHLTAKLSLYTTTEYQCELLSFSLEFLSKWQNPSRVSYEFNFETAVEGSKDLSILELAQENLYIKKWSKYQNNLSTYSFDAPSKKKEFDGDRIKHLFKGKNFRFRLRFKT